MQISPPAGAAGGADFRGDVRRVPADQTKTHQSLFVYEHEDDGDDDDPHHGKPSAHSSAWHTVWLIVHLIAVIAVTKMNANPLEALLTELNAPVAFTGFWWPC